MTTREKQPLLSLNRGSIDDESNSRRFELNHPSEQGKKTVCNCTNTLRGVHSPFYSWWAYKHFKEGHQEYAANLCRRSLSHHRQLSVEKSFCDHLSSLSFRLDLVRFRVRCLLILNEHFARYFMCLEFDDECLGNAHLIGGSHGPLERFFVGFFFSVQTQMTIG